MMDRYTVVMRHKHFEFPWYSFIKLYSALLCPHQTHEKDPKHRMP